MTHTNITRLCALQAAVLVSFPVLPALAETDQPAAGENKVTEMPAPTSVNIELTPTVTMVCGIAVVRNRRGDDAIRVVKDHCVPVDREGANIR